LASNIEDTEPTVGDTPPPEKPTEKAAEKQPAPSETTDKSAGAPPPAAAPPEPSPLMHGGPGHQRRKAAQGVKNGTPTLDLVELNRLEEAGLVRLSKWAQTPSTYQVA